MKSCLLTPHSLEDWMQTALEDICLAEWMPGSGQKQEAGLPLTNKFLEHVRKLGVHVNFLSSVLGLLEERIQSLWAVPAGDSRRGNRLGRQRELGYCSYPVLGVGEVTVGMV